MSSGPIQRGLWFIVLAVLALVSVAQARTITAASCSQSDVQTALSAAVAGDTVAIPAGTCTWTTQVSWAAPADVILQGAGNSSLGGGDQTIIIDSFSSSNELLSIKTSNLGYFRIKGITFQGGSTGSGNDKYNGMLRISGLSSAIRIDHVHMSSRSYSPSTNGALLQFVGCVYGVIDHALFDANAASVTNSIRFDNAGSCFSDALGVGDQVWAHSTDLGSANFLFVEDSTFNGGVGNDCSTGGRFVWRHNTMNISSPLFVQTHPTGGGARHRGCRAWEIYNNLFATVAGTYIHAGFWLSSGTGVVWGNTIPSSSAGGGTGVRSLISGHVMRYDTSTYTQTAPPNGWGYCGTHQTGSASAWDQNTDATGHLCLDQPGAGISQLLINDFPNTVNQTTGTIAWPQQALEPVYEWANAYSPVPNNPSGIWASNEPALLVANRDYYLGTTNAGAPISFNGTSGVGAGLLSARPATCTAKVAYWATDTSTLYKCASTNTWTAYYTPYTYPHPLVSGGPVGFLLRPPSNLRVQ